MAWSWLTSCTVPFVAEGSLQEHALPLVSLRNAAAVVLHHFAVDGAIEAGVHAKSVPDSFRGHPPFVRIEIHRIVLRTLLRTEEDDTNRMDRIYLNGEDVHQCPLQWSLVEKGRILRWPPAAVIADKQLRKLRTAFRFLVAEESRSAEDFVVVGDRLGDSNSALYPVEATCSL